MKKFMMKYFMVNCKEATFLTAKKEDGLLSFMESIKLTMHTSMCSFCKKFENQISQIGKESKQIRAENNLSESTKEKIENMLKEQGS